MGALAGRIVAVTRPQQQRDRLSALLTDLGATVAFYPLIAIRPPGDPAPLTAAVRELAEFDWVVFTSANAVERVCAVIETVGQSQSAAHGSATLPRTRIAAVGSATRDALMRHGLRVDVVPDRALAERIPALMGDLRGARVLLPRSDIARPELPDALRRGGATVTEVVAYRTCRTGDAHALVLRAGDNGLDAITFASASAVTAFAETADDTLDVPRWAKQVGRPRIVAIGPITARAACHLRLPVDAIASTHDSAGLARAVVECFTSLPAESA